MGRGKDKKTSPHLFPRVPRTRGFESYVARRKSAVHEVLQVIRFTALSVTIILLTSFAFNKDWKILLLAIFFAMIALGKWSLAAGFGLFYDSMTDFYITPQLASFLAQEFNLPQDTAQIVAKLIIVAVASILLGSMRRVTKFIANLGSSGIIFR